jgi:excisionase family DNA binding protein
VTVTDDATPAGLLTPAEVAAVFRVSPATVARWVRQGKLPAVETPSGRNRFHPDDVAAFSETRVPRTTPRQRAEVVSRLSGRHS